MKSHRLQKFSDFLKIFTGSSLAHPQGRKNLATHNCDVMQNDEGTISYVNRFNMCIEDVFGQLSHNSNCCICPLWLPQWWAFIRESEWEQVCGNPGLTTHKTDQLTWIANHWQTHSNMKLRSIKEKIAIFLAILKNIKSINHRSRLIFFFAISLFICNIHTEYSYKLFLSNELFHPSLLYLLLLHWSQWNP